MLPARVCCEDGLLVYAYDKWIWFNIDALNLIGL